MVVSVGSLVDPQVLTSVAVEEEAALILESANLKSAGEEQVLPVGWFIYISNPPFGIQGSLNPGHYTRNLARN